ncbi:hypothetical protein [Wenxinia marina]|uniref:Uncharacterized protein n=1 Tax=Wenxinia marina DSM 24838 TaxID=1123501 RepID=A0A0D0QGZ5_9RHOB|nr:hypothetical protein [Wenxinia marina]KIQ70303.1 hypothetical protein Wenmar_00678 [Wenxinia marina DSM 24838]GGL54173.1 hypothetical protein GCM10011392_05730 [Wenxinia marina]
MSTSTSRIILAAGAVAALALSGCGAVRSLPFAASAGPGEIALYGGRLTVAGAEGYCPDRDASRPGEGFAILAACPLVGGDGPMPATDAFVTVQAGAPGSAGVAGNEPGLATLLTSPEGIALLSASGNPDAVTVTDVERSDGLVAVRFADATTRRPGLAPTEWRAFLDLQGRLTTVSVRGFDRAPLSPSAGAALLRETVAALRAANPGAAGGMDAAAAPQVAVSFSDAGWQE